MYRGLGIMGPDGTPLVDTTSPDSVIFDYSGGFSVVPGAPGSAGGQVPAGYGAGWGIPIANAPATTSINPLYLIGGGLGLVLVISLLGGRRR